MSLATVTIFGFALLAISYARATSVDCCWRRCLRILAIYLMINPDQGELFDGADDGGLRAGGFSDGQTVR